MGGVCRFMTHPLCTWGRGWARVVDAEGGLADASRTTLSIHSSDQWQRRGAGVDERDVEFRANNHHLHPFQPKSLPWRKLNSSLARIWQSIRRPRPDLRQPDWAACGSLCPR